MGPILKQRCWDEIAEEMSVFPEAASLPAGRPSHLTCPECNGVLWELQQGKLLRYRCRVGHILSQQSMVSHNQEALEQPLWAALRALEESAELDRRMSGHYAAFSTTDMSRMYADAAEDKIKQARMVREMLLTHGWELGITEEEGAP